MSLVLKPPLPSSLVRLPTPQKTAIASGYSDRQRYVGKHAIEQQKILSSAREKTKIQCKVDACNKISKIVTTLDKHEQQ
jgi:hypothetical protein